MVDGRLIVIKDEQFLKLAPPMVMMVDGIVISMREVQFINAKLSIDVISESTSTRDTSRRISGFPPR